MAATNLFSFFPTNQIRTAIRTTVASLVGVVLTYVAAHNGAFHLGGFTFAWVPVASALYYSVISFLENRFPSLGWLLGVLPQPKTSPLIVTVPTVVPAPTPTPAPVVTPPTPTVPPTA